MFSSWSPEQTSNPDTEKNVDPLAGAGSGELIRTCDHIERSTALLDAFICSFQRSTTLFFGRIVSNPNDLPQFQDWLGYSMTYNGVPYGNGNALHLHNSVEIFVALDGDFEIGYTNPRTELNVNGEDSSREDNPIFTTVLKPMDLIACPAGCFHYYKNVDGSKQVKQILTILPGRPSVTWAPEVVHKARCGGAKCNDRGVLELPPATYSDDKPTMMMVAPEFPPVAGIADGDLAPFVRRYSDGVTSPQDHEKNVLRLGGPLDFADDIGEHQKMTVPHDSWIKIAYHDLDLQERYGASSVLNLDQSVFLDQDHPRNADFLVVVLKGRVSLNGGEPGQKFDIQNEILGPLDMFKLPSRRVDLSKVEDSNAGSKDYGSNGGGKTLWKAIFRAQGEERATLLIVASKLPHNFDFFFNPKEGGRLKK